MLRTLMAIIAGQISISLLSGFSRLAISLYLDTELSLTGISQFPSLSWGIAMTGLSFIYGIIGGLITCLIARSNYKIEILCLTLLIAMVSLFDYYFLNETEPLWYLLANSGLKIGGLFVGYKLMLTQEISNKTVNN